MLSFPLDPNDDKLDEFERVNGMDVWIYGLSRVDDLSDITIYRIPPGNFEKEVRLMLVNGHYSLIHDWNKLCGTQGKFKLCNGLAPDSTRKRCPRCMHPFYDEQKYNDHVARKVCSAVRNDKPTQE